MLLGSLSFENLPAPYRPLIFKHLESDRNRPKRCQNPITPCAAKGQRQNGIGHFFQFRSPFSNRFVTLLTFSVTLCLSPFASPTCGRVTNVCHFFAYFWPISGSVFFLSCRGSCCSRALSSLHSNTLFAGGKTCHGYFDPIPGTSGVYNLSAHGSMILYVPLVLGLESLHYTLQ